MRLRNVILGCVLLTVCAVAQTEQAEPRVSLNVLVEGLGDPDLIEVSALTQEIQRRGIDFDLGKQLGAILAAATKGKRDPEQVADLVMACLSACQDCRARFLAPMTSDELLARLKSGFTPASVLREVQARGVKDLDDSEAAAHMWRSKGATEELVNLLLPDDKIPSFPLVGYTALTLKHAEEYDPGAPKGWLKITAQIPANSQNEFVFQHTALFVRAVKGAEPTDVIAYFNKPAPRNTTVDLVDFNSGLEGGPAAEEKRGGLLGLRKGKAVVAPVIEASYMVGRDDSRNAFRVVLTNKDTSPQQYSFYLRWQVLITPKVSTPAPKQ
jgi:hypothetical protein